MTKYLVFFILLYITVFNSIRQLYKLMLIGSKYVCESIKKGMYKIIISLGDKQERGVHACKNGSTNIKSFLWELKGPGPERSWTEPN